MSAPTTIMCDNQSAIKKKIKLVFHDKTKHFEIDWHFIQEKVEEKIVQVDFISTTKQFVDILTKALSRIKFETCRSRFNQKNVEFQS
jgi:hypothetical protein